MLKQDIIDFYNVHINSALTNFPALTKAELENALRLLVLETAQSGSFSKEFFNSVTEEEYHILGCYLFNPYITAARLIDKKMDNVQEKKFQ